jgi:hypothetical protein
MRLNGQVLVQLIYGTVCLCHLQGALTAVIASRMRELAEQAEKKASESTRLRKHRAQRWDAASRIEKWYKRNRVQRLLEAVRALKGTEVTLLKHTLGL